MVLSTVTKLALLEVEYHGVCRLTELYLLRMREQRLCD